MSASPLELPKPAPDPQGDPRSRLKLFQEQDDGSLTPLVPVRPGTAPAAASAPSIGAAPSAVEPATDELEAGFNREAPVVKKAFDVVDDVNNIQRLRAKTKRASADKRQELNADLNTAYGELGRTQVDLKKSSIGNLEALKYGIEQLRKQDPAEQTAYRTAAVDRALKNVDSALRTLQIREEGTKDAKTAIGQTINGITKGALIGSGVTLGSLIGTPLGPLGGIVGGVVGGAGAYVADTVIWNKLLTKVIPGFARSVLKPVAQVGGAVGLGIAATTPSVLSYVGASAATTGAVFGIPAAAAGLLATYFVTSYLDKRGARKKEERQDA